MAFRDIYTGGACNVNQNPFHQMMNNILLGQAEQKQQLQMMGVQQDQNVESSIQAREAQFKMMNQAWGQLQGQFEQMSIQERQKMEMAFQQAQQDQLQMQQFQQFNAEQQWNEAQLQYEADQLTQEFKFQEAFDNAEIELAEEEKQKVIKDAANDMMSLMMNDPDPKFQESKFLGFLKKVNQGDLVIKGKELLNKQGEKHELPALLDQDFQKMENAWQTSEQQQEEQKQQPLDYEDVWNKRLDDYENQRADEKNFEQMLEAQYKKILQDMENGGNVDDLMSDAWQKASDIQEQELYKDSNDMYRFQEVNPYMNKEFPLQIAMELTSTGQTSEAILAFEAHLQKNNTDSNAWRVMGRLHQENDQDQKAVTSFLNAQKNDPENLDTLLALGISCTNILDEVKAMSFLKQWIMKNPKYSGVLVDPSIVPDNNTIYDFSIEEIKQMNRNMIDVYEHAKVHDPNDADLYNALAVLYFISRDYSKSVELFKRALQIEPKNYSLWNKLGATLAHLDEPNQAMFCYHRALDLRPNYVRVWVNLGIAYAHKGEYHEAARLYLSALALNPQAKHIWGFIQTCFMCMQRSDLITKIYNYDPKVFSDEFQVIDIKDLPQPEIFYQEANQEFIFKMNTEGWVNEFNNLKQQNP